MGEFVALLQLNPIVGDIDANVAEIERAIALAAANGAVIAWTSELAVCGYPPRDLLLEEGFVVRVRRVIRTGSLHSVMQCFYFCFISSEDFPACFARFKNHLENSIEQL